MKLNEIPRLPEIIPTEAELMSTWEGSAEDPLLTVVCSTYNHAPFIREAIHGFLIQKTKFPFRVVIHDDASTDDTAAIVQDYERRYPKLIKGIYQKTNLYSRRLSREPYVNPHLAGKYRAVCEGDDYWTDPKKLQIQVQFLEENPEYVVSGHDAFIRNERGGIVSMSKLPESQKRDFDGDDLIFARAWILTMSMVHRMVLPDEVIPERKYILNGDRFAASLLGRYGRSKYHAEIKPACYRQHSGGVWSSKDALTRREDHINTWFWIYRYYNRIGEHEIGELWKQKWQAAVLRTIQNKEQVLDTVPIADVLRFLAKKLSPQAIFKSLKSRVLR